ncbi:hypothetical protein R1sor_013325 [Riccia sorocarpa]|uniref:Uncharacterized protein n=1 Tax=Riccia sorocarpa TaxID=122646 RepID=A0ABD3H884_9MARC
MKSFFQQTAEPLPHKESRNENTDGIIYRLPKALSRDNVYREILGKMEAVGMTAISRVAFDNLWKKEFPNYGMHNSSAFAKCFLCVKFTTMLQRERRSAERAKLELDREKHLKHQMSGRTSLLDLLLESTEKLSSKKIHVVATSVVVATGITLLAAPVVVPAVVTGLGFTSGGIAAGSWAASFMASYGGAVGAGSACAVMQSIGAVGTFAGSTIAAAVGGALTAGGAVLGVAV